MTAPTQRNQRLKARIERLTAALREALTDNYWNAYHCGVVRDGKWMDGGISEAEGLRYKMELGDGWHDCGMIQRQIPRAVEIEIAGILEP